jgi:hypothetical protein
MKLMRMLAVATLLASSHLVYGDDTEVMSVNVPFPFTAAGVSMPAGRYVIYRLQEGQLWRLRTYGHFDIFVPVKSVPLKEAPATSALVFDHDRSGYKLRQIDQQAQTDGVEIVDSNRTKPNKAGELVASGKAPAR